MSYIRVNAAATRTKGSHSFDVADNRGRVIGADFEITETEADGNVVYAVRVQATRAGKAFGSSNPWQGFASESERACYLVKYLQDAKKRAARNAA